MTRVAIDGCRAEQSPNAHLTSLYSKQAGRQMDRSVEKEKFDQLNDLVPFAELVAAAISISVLIFYVQRETPAVHL